VALGGFTSPVVSRKKAELGSFVSGVGLNLDASSDRPKAALGHFISEDVVPRPAAALGAFRSEAEVNDGVLEANSALGGFTPEAEVNETVREAKSALGCFLSVTTPNGVAPPAELGASAVAVLPLELGLGSDGRSSADLRLLMWKDGAAESRRLDGASVHGLSRAYALSMESLRLLYDLRRSGWNLPSNGFANWRSVNAVREGPISA
jgi:hypothetical protein